MACSGPAGPGDLESLAGSRFGQLGEAELRLLRAAPKGDTARCGPSPLLGVPGNDPAGAGGWGSERTIRAGLISWLCVDAEAIKRIDPAGIQILGAKIVGRLNLFFANIGFPLLFQCCCFYDDIDLKFATVPALNLTGSSMRSVIADGVHVRGDVSLDEGFTSSGEVRVLDAQIGGSLCCRAGTFKNPVGVVALAADRADIKGSALLDEGFSAEGQVRLSGVKVGSQVICNSGAFGELNLQGATVGSFLWLKVQNARRSRLDLTNASADAILDEESSWPGPGNLLLDGFVYKRFVNSPTDARTRLGWLNRQGEFKPQPYLQLAKVLRETGDERGARKVLFEMEDRRRKAQDRRWYQRWLNQVLRRTIGYGQMSWWALAWLLALALIGSVLFGCGYLGGAMAPTEERAYEFFAQRGYPPDYYPQFNPLVYSIEHSFPLVNLGMKDHWAPNHGIPAGLLVLHWRGPRWMHDATVCGIHIFQWNAPGLLRLCFWLQVPLGWGLGTLFVAGLTGIVKSG